MIKKCITEPPIVFFTSQGIVIPDPKDRENAPRVFQRALEMAGVCFAKSFLARLRNEDGDVMHEDALVTIAGDGGDLMFHCADPFTYVKRENRVVEIRWQEDSGSWRGWQSRSKNREHVQTLTPQQQRMLDYISAESGMESKSDDWIRLLGMRIVPYPMENASKE
jgi:hypothetical protein